MTMMMGNNNNNNVSSTAIIGQQQNLGDTTLTKVFVGGLAWETPKEAMRDHFEKYGEILEAVIISDKVTGRSKGYGFVTFKEAEAAKKACEDATPMINGRRANCNLASLGARRPRPSSSNMPPPPPPPPPPTTTQGGNNVVVVGPRGPNTAAPANHMPWYYPSGAPTAAAASPFAHHHHHHHPQHHQAVPFYGYSPTYIAADMSYNHKVGYSGASYMNGHFSQVYPGQPMIQPMYPLYHFHQSHTLGLPAAHLYSSTSPGPVASVPALMSKPTSFAPTTVCLAVE